MGGGIPDGTTLTEDGMGADELVVWPVRTIVEVDYPCIRLGSKMSMKLTAVGQGIGFVVDAKMLCIALFGGFIELGGHVTCGYSRSKERENDIRNRIVQSRHQSRNFD